MLTVTTRPGTMRLTSLARLKRELGVAVSDTSQDETLEDLLEEVSSDIAAFLGDPVVRAAVTEERDADGSRTLLLDRTPVVRLDAVRYRQVAVRDVQVQNPDAGVLYRQLGFTSTQPIEVWLGPSQGPPPGEASWAVDYLAGYLTRDDDVVASGVIGVDGTTRRFTRSSGSFPLVASGETITVAGFSETTNNGAFTVVDRTALSVTVLEPLTDEVPAAQTVTMQVHTLPGDLERCAIDEIKNRYLRRTRESNLKSERIGDWSATYAIPETRETSNGFSPDVEGRLWRRRRVV